VELTSVDVATWVSQPTVLPASRTASPASGTDGNVFEQLPEAVKKSAVPPTRVELTMSTINGSEKPQVGARRIIGPTGPTVTDER
jgi:hypothetical protein